MTEEQMQNLGRNIYMLLYDRKMSRRQLAGKVGCTESFISKVVAGEKTPSLARFIKIAEVLGVTTDELISNRIGCQDK